MFSQHDLFLYYGVSAAGCEKPKDDGWQRKKQLLVMFAIAQWFQESMYRHNPSFWEAKILCLAKTLERTLSQCHTVKSTIPRSLGTISTYPMQSRQHD